MFIVIYNLSKKTKCRFFDKSTIVLLIKSGINYVNIYLQFDF